MLAETGGTCGASAFHSNCGPLLVRVCGCGGRTCILLPMNHEHPYYLELVAKVWMIILDILIDKWLHTV